jgi:hypothetical protein
VPLAAIVLAPFLVAVLRGWRLSGATSTRSQTRLNYTIALALISIPWIVPLEGGLETDLFAVDALEYVQPGRLFHDDGVGGYLIYAEWPDRQVFIDDRAELYGDTFVDFVKARGGEAVWKDVFGEFDLTQALLKRNDPLLEVLLANGWNKVYADRDFSVLIAPSSG